MVLSKEKRMNTTQWAMACGWITALTLSVYGNEMAELPPSDTVKPELYATGIEWAEGPAFDRHGDLFVVNYRGYLYMTVTGKEAVFRLKLGVLGFDYWGTGG
jgi:hypothetical protein